MNSHQRRKMRREAPVHWHQPIVCNRQFLEALERFVQALKASRFGSVSPIPDGLQSWMPDAAQVREP